MHAWLWGESHPEFADALLPLACLPAEIAGRNRMFRRMIVDSIRNDPEWKGGDYARQPRGLVSAIHVLLVMVSAPLAWQNEYPTREAADRFLEDQVRSRVAATDANDMLYQFEASRDYDPAPNLAAIRAPLLAINFADDQVNPPELAILERAIAKVPRGRAIVMPITEKTRGHRTHSLPEVWKAHLAAFLAETETGAPATRGAAAAGAPREAPGADAAAVEALERELVGAIGRRDLATYDRLVADDYAASGVDGKTVTKAEVVASYRSGARGYRDLSIYDVSARVHGDTAVVTARTKGFRVEDGKETENRVRYVRVYARRNGEWRAVSQFAARE
jgi:ketosteroid isomerase-like protein